MEAFTASWIHLAVMLPRSAMHSRKYPKRGNKPGEVPGFRWTRSQFSEEEERKNSLKMKDRRGNVYENKGPAFQSMGASWNVMCAPTARIASGWKSHPDSCR